MKTIKTVTFLPFGIMGLRAEVSAKPVHGPMNLVGLYADIRHRETVVRLRAAMEDAGVSTSVDLSYELPTQRRTASHSLDLAAAIAAAVAGGMLPESAVEGWAFFGELSLNGLLRPTRGLLPCVLAARAAGLKCLVPSLQSEELAPWRDDGVFAVSSLPKAIEGLRFGSGFSRAGNVPAAPPESGCFSEIVDNDAAKRALEIAAAGGHSIALIGAFGSGKTLLAKRVTGILPELTGDLAREVACLYSAAGISSGRVGVPFRAPHHSVSSVGITGGGDPARPGEAALAHSGVLFLDELCEFPGDVFDAARGASEYGVVDVRSDRDFFAQFPARSLLIGADAACLCGRRTTLRPRPSSYHAGCVCTPAQVRQHAYRARSRVAAFQLAVELERRSFEPGEEAGKRETSAEIRARVIAARERQIARQGRLNGHCNDLSSQTSIAASVAKTIADLEGAAVVSDDHIAEARRLVSSEIVSALF